MESNIFCYKNVWNNVTPLGDGDIINEVDYFTITVKSKIELLNHCLLITDIPVEITLVERTTEEFIYTIDENSVREYFNNQDFDKVYDLYKTKFLIPNYKRNLFFYKLFINYPIGLCEIVLVKKDSYEKIASFKLNIVSSKIDEFEFESLVSYVESKGSSIWAKFSLIKQQADNFTDEDRLDWLLIFCENLLNEFQDKYLVFYATDKIIKLENQNVIETFDGNNSISEESIIWLLSNLEVLTPTNSYDTNKFLVNNRPFFATDILSAYVVETTDNPENQLVHGFIDELIFFINDLFRLFTNEIETSNCDRFEDMVMFYANKRKLKVTKELRKSLNKIKDVINIEIPVSRIEINLLHVNKIESKEHYYYIYNKLMLWLLYKSATYTNTHKFFKGISRLDELFERACYYQILDIFIKEGYTPILDNNNTNKDEIFEEVSLYNGTRKINLYYQKLPESLTTTKNIRRQLKPDFIFEFDDNTFIILDAKYKKPKNIELYDYPELSLKYLHGIGPKNGGHFDVIGLLVLYPNSEFSRSFYHKNEYGIDGTSTIYPFIGSIGVNFIETTVVSPLLSTIKRILEIKNY